MKFLLVPKTNKEEIVLINLTVSNFVRSNLTATLLCFCLRKLEIPHSITSTFCLISQSCPGNELELLDCASGIFYEIPIEENYDCIQMIISPFNTNQQIITRNGYNNNTGDLKWRNMLPRFYSFGAKIASLLSQACIINLEDVPNLWFLIVSRS